MGIEQVIGQAIQQFLGGMQGARPAASSAQGQGHALRSADGGWDASIGGSHPRPALDRALADVAGAAYDPDRMEASGWHRLGDGELAQAGIDPGLQYRDGMRAGVYTDRNGHYVVAYAGNTGEDAPTVVAQSAGVDTLQVNDAVALAHAVENRFGGDNVVYTGHSMGGALAGAAAAATGSTSVVFNAQGVHDNTLARLGLDPASTRAAMGERSRAYGVDGDWATLVQNDIPFANALPDALGADLRIANPEGLTNLANAHNLGPIIGAFDQGLAIRSGAAQPQLLEQPLENLFNAFTGLLQGLPIRV
jgi:hypothetical protein